MGRGSPPKGRVGREEGFHINLTSFHSEKGNSRTTQRKQRKEAPPKGGGGGSTTKRTRGSQGQGEGTTAQKKEGREKFPSPLWWSCLPSPPQGGGAFPVSPFGWCRFYSSSLLGGAVSFFSKTKTFFKELRLVRLTEVKFSSVEWWSLLLLHFSGAAFLCLLFSGAAWPPPPLGGGAGSRKKKSTSPKGASVEESTTTQRRRRPFSTTQRRRRPSSTTQKKRGGEAAPPERDNWGQLSEKQNHKKKAPPENKPKKQRWILAQ